MCLVVADKSLSTEKHSSHLFFFKTFELPAVIARKRNDVTIDNFISGLSQTSTLLAVHIEGTVCKVPPFSGQILAYNAHSCTLPLLKLACDLQRPAHTVHLFLH